MEIAEPIVRFYGRFKDDAVNLLGGDKPERIQMGLASGDFFGVLGVGAHLGRTFSESEALRPE